MFLLTLLLFTTIALRSSAVNYLFAYYMDQNAVKDFLGHVGLGAAATGADSSLGKSALDALGLLVKPDGSNAASVGLSLFMVLGNVIQVIGILLSKPLAERFGKKAVFIAGLSMTTLANLVVFCVSPTSVTLLVMLSALWSLGWGPTVPLLWVMIADAADYSEWKSQRRATGFMYAGILFALKAGLGLGGALVSWIMDAYGYVANVAQSAQSLLGIRLSASLFSAIPFFVALICLAAYPISKQLNLQIQSELTERRKRFAPS
jgi:Na+/melibiose symporter-like transporter